MKKPLLFVPIETKVREYHGKLFFSCVAAERGYEVVLGYQKTLMKWIHAYGHGTYIDKSMTEGKVPWFDRCRAMGNRVAAWDEEGLVFLNIDTFKKMRLHGPAFHQLSQHYCWGPLQYEAVCERFPDDTEKVEVTGNSRFDTLRPELRTVYQKRVQELKNEFGRILLINTNFAFANHFRGLAAIQHQLARYEEADEPGFFDNWRKIHEQALESFQEAIPLLREKYPDHTIIIRPHPSEGHEVWNTLADRLSDTHVRTDGNVVEWILASDALVHFSCTTGIEAFVLGVPAIAYRKVHHELYEQPLPTALSYSAFSEEELLSTLDAVMPESGEEKLLRDDQERMAMARQYIHALDGPYASDLLVDALQKLPELDRQRPVIKHAELWLRRSYPLLRDSIRSWRKPDPYILNKFPGMDAEELRETIHSFRQGCDRFYDVTVKPSMPGCFLLSGKNNLSIRR